MYQHSSAATPSKDDDLTEGLRLQLRTPVQGGPPSLLAGQYFPSDAPTLEPYHRPSVSASGGTQTIDAHRDADMHRTWGIHDYSNRQDSDNNTVSRDWPTHNDPELSQAKDNGRGNEGAVLIISAPDRGGRGDEQGVLVAGQVPLANYSIGLGSKSPRGPVQKRPASSSGQGTAPPRTLAPVRDLSPRRDVTRTTSGTASASSGGAHRRPGGGGRGHGDAEHSIFVGDLALDVTAEDLVDVFRNPSIGVPPQSEDEPRRLIKPFLSCSSAKVMSEPETNGSKGYGFVRFSNRDEMVRALVEMQGVYCCGRPMRIASAPSRSKPPIASATTSRASPPRPLPPIDTSWREGPPSESNSRPTSRLSTSFPPIPPSPQRSSGRGPPQPSPITSFSPSSPLYPGSNASLSPLNYRNTGSSAGQAQGRGHRSGVSNSLSPGAGGSRPLSALSHRSSAGSGVRPITTIDDVPKPLLRQIVTLAKGGLLDHLVADDQFTSEEDGEIASMFSSLPQLRQAFGVGVGPHNLAPRGSTSTSHSSSPPRSSPAPVSTLAYERLHEVRSATSTSQAPTRTLEISTSHLGMPIDRASPLSSAANTSPLRDSASDITGFSVAPALSDAGSFMDDDGNDVGNSVEWNTTVFVGGLSSAVTEEELLSCFGVFGEIHYVKVPPGKACGFVQYVRKADATQAIQNMQGVQLGGRPIRLSWGRSQAKAVKQAAALADSAEKLSLGPNASPSRLPLSSDEHVRRVPSVAGTPIIVPTVIEPSRQRRAPPQSTNRSSTSFARPLTVSTELSSFSNPREIPLRLSSNQSSSRTPSGRGISVACLPHDSGSRFLSPMSIPAGMSVHQGAGQHRRTPSPHSSSMRGMGRVFPNSAPLRSMRTAEGMDLEQMLTRVSPEAMAQHSSSFLQQHPGGMNDAAYLVDRHDELSRIFDGQLGASRSRMGGEYISSEHHPPIPAPSARRAYNDVSEFEMNAPGFAGGVLPDVGPGVAQSQQHVLRDQYDVRQPQDAVGYRQRQQSFYDPFEIGPGFSGSNMGVWYGPGSSALHSNDDISLDPQRVLEEQSDRPMQPGTRSGRR